MEIPYHMYLIIIRAFQYLVFPHQMILANFIKTVIFVLVHPVVDF